MSDERAVGAGMDTANVSFAKALLASIKTSSGEPNGAAAELSAYRNSLIDEVDLMGG